MFTYSIGYWEVYRRFEEDFFGWKEGLIGRSYVRGTFIDEFVMGDKNFHVGNAGFSSII